MLAAGSLPFERAIVASAPAESRSSPRPRGLPLRSVVLFDGEGKVDVDV